jgi:hypothetical protein
MRLSVIITLVKAAYPSAVARSIPNFRSTVIVAGDREIGVGWDHDEAWRQAWRLIGFEQRCDKFREVNRE